MINEDTVYLLRECNSGTQMAVYSLNEVLEKVQNPQLKEILSSSKEQHEKLGNELHALLRECGDTTKEPSPMAKGMSWIKTNAKLAIDDSDKVCADLITDGCNMGSKTVQRYLNKYPAADNRVREKAEELIQIEEALTCQLKIYL